MIACPKCHTVQPAAHINTGSLKPCPACRSLMRADVFAAFFRSPVQTAPVESVQEHGQAECFNHPGKRAAAACSICGRLLCSLCEVIIDGRSLCMTCLHAGQEKRKIVSLDNRRVLYDSIALNLAFWPMFAIFPIPVTAPAALYVTLRYWRRPGSLLKRSRYRFVLASFLAMAQIVVCVLALVDFFN